MDLEQLPAALAAAGDRLGDLPDTLPPKAAALLLERTRPPRLTGALEATGRVDRGAVVFGGGVVDYAAPVHAANPFLTRAAEATEAELLDLTATEVDTATTL